MNYFSAAHLAYSGRTDAALAMLKRTIEGRYCSYPAVDKDPMLQSLRAQPGFPALRTSAIACQSEFVAQRDQAAR